MKEKPEKLLVLAKDLQDTVRGMVFHTDNLDLQRLLKQIDADLMDLQHKITMVIELSSKESEK